MYGIYFTPDDHENGAAPIHTADGWTVRRLVADLASRDVLGYLSVMERLRTNGRVYVAAARGSKWDTQHDRRGFIVGKVPA